MTSQNKWVHMEYFLHVWPCAIQGVGKCDYKIVDLGFLDLRFKIEDHCFSLPRPLVGPFARPFRAAGNGKRVAFERLGIYDVGRVPAWISESFERLSLRV